MPIRNQHGFTLTELLTGLSVAMLLAAAAFTVASTSERSATASNRTAEMQQNARIAMDLLTQDLKMAGYGQTGMIGCATGIVPSDNTPAGPDTGPDSVSLIVPTPLSTLGAATGAGAGTAQLQNGAVAGINAAYAPEVFGAGSWVTINGAFTTQVTGIVAGDTLNLASATGATTVFPATTPVTWLRCVTYSIGQTTAACSGAPPCLLRGSGGNNVVIADGIEDLQLAYGCDGCIVNGVADGIIDDLDNDGAVSGNDFLPNTAMNTLINGISAGSWTQSPRLPGTIRLVRATIVARQVGIDMQVGGDQNAYQIGTRAPIVVEDHNPTTGVFLAGDYDPTTYSRYRRRVVTRTVQLRNIGL